VEADYEMFLRDLEEDPELRGTVNMYRTDAQMADVSATAAIRRGGKGKAAFAMDTDPTPAVPEATTAAQPGMDDVDENEDEEVEDDEVDFPEIKMDELLDVFEDLAIAEEPQEE